jgi:methyl-accepting chemotaxis protein
VKIRGKIYLIVGVMGLISVCIGGIAVHVVSEFSEKLHQYENAADRAFLGEHLNRQVTAVVMEARGIYASKDMEGAKKFAEGIAKELDGIDQTLNEWRPSVPAEQKPAFDAVVTRSAEFRTFRTETARLGTTVSIDAANEQGNNELNRANRKAFQKEIDAVVQTDNENLTAIKADIAAFETLMLTLVLGTVGAGLLIGGGTAFYIATNELSRPIQNVTNTMNRLAGGDLDTEVPYAGRKDEIGEMAGAVAIFRQNAITVRDLNAQEQVLREKSADLQSSIATVVHAAAAGDFSSRIGKDYQNEDLNRFARSVNELVAGVEGGIAETRRVIGALADGDLTQTMDGSFRGAFAELQQNVNATFATLQRTMREVRASTDAINANSGELRTASDDLSQAHGTAGSSRWKKPPPRSTRSPRPCATPPTRAANEASRMVAETTQSTGRSGTIVRDAIAAMSRIEDASSASARSSASSTRSPSRPTSWRSMPASRPRVPGEAGKWLCGRGAGSARTCPACGQCGEGDQGAHQQVRHRSRHRRGAGALDGRCADRDRGARQQGERPGDTRSRRPPASRRPALPRSTPPVNQMDQMTQQNAAMVEETSAATHKLKSEADSLADLMARFRTGDTVQRMAPVRADTRPVESPARRMIGNVTRAFGGNRATATAAVAQDNWEEF